MKRYFRNIGLLLFPLVLVVSINEFTRYSLIEKQSEKSINTTKKLTKKCTWACHNDTNHCKENHVKILGPYFDYTDPLYFGIINSLQKTGSYNLANLIAFVLLIPLTMLFLFIRILNMQQEIKQVKSKTR